MRLPEEVEKPMTNCNGHTQQSDFTKGNLW